MTEKIKNVLDKLKKSETVRNTATLGIGTGISQLIPILMSFILSRIYTPEAYGDYGIFINYANIILVFVCARYEYAIMLPKKEHEAINIFNLCILISLIVCGLLYLILIGGDIADIKLVEELPYKYLLPAYIFAASILQISNNYANRTERYKVISTAAIGRSVIQAAARTAMGLMKNFGGLIWGCFIATASSMAYIVFSLNIFRKTRKLMSFKDMKMLMKRYSNFPKYQMPGSLMNILSTSLPVILLGWFYTKETVGFFTMSISLLYIPISMIGNVLGQLYYKRATSSSKANTSRFALQIFSTNYIIGIVMFFTILIGGEKMFEVLLGEEWSKIGEYSLLLSPWLICSLCLTPLTWTFDAYNKLKTEMNINILMFIVRVLSIIICGYSGISAEKTIMIYGGIGLLLYLIQGFYIYKNLEIKTSFKYSLAILASSILIISIWASRAAVLILS